MKGCHIYKTILLIIFSFFLVRCVEPPSFGVVPEITDVIISTDSTLTDNTLNVDTIICNQKFYMHIFFQDGDGNIGLPPDVSVNNLYITESRTDFTDAFTIPEIQENGKITDISGSIKIMLTEACISFNGITPIQGCTLDDVSTNTINYKVQMKDNEGNTSNEFNSPNLIIKCE